MTQLELTNAALSIIGEPPISSVSEDVPRADRAEAVFQPLLERFLREHPWNWAKTRVALEPASPVPIFEWSNRFELPDDFVTLVQVNGVACGPTKVGVLYEIEGTNLLANTTLADIQYIWKPDDSGRDTFLSLMDGLSADAFTVLLASKLANPLSRDSASLGQQLYQQFMSVDLPRARTKNAQEAKLPTYIAPINSRSIRARSVWGGGLYPGVTDL